NFTIATSEVYRDRNTGERKETTEWHNIVLWRNLAEIAQKYLHKGDMVYIEGKLRTRSWEKDGVTRYTTEVVADNMTMLTPKGSSGASPADSTPANKPAAENFTPMPETNASDDLPF
ncbi:MAG: single-stranded DNA-binding protein, partial [Cyclobacteriaceae bacterium]|nr:single-stranded DNA-binding protein [Cyclobacteriaceae bacterium]MDW8330801.1 single-stranded DNA-binding protein [Cyclobacteriaceae bacterium]